MAGQKRHGALAAAFLLTALLIGAQAAGEEATSTPLAGNENRRQIEEKAREIKRLEEEAQAYRVTLDDLERATDTLESQVQTIDRALKRIEANIRVTNAKIAKANLEIRELVRGIGEKEATIDIDRAQLGYLVTLLAESDRETPLEILMKQETLSKFFTSVDSLRGVQRGIQNTIAELRSARQELKNRKAETESKRLELRALADELADQKALQVEERKARNQLLADTKNQERRYQELLSEVERKREALQQEINALEAGLSADFDRTAIPAPGSGILGWPLPEPIFITQYFGRTAFARSGAYSGKGHNGIDFRAAAGTPVFAAAGGTVRAAGDTDTACRRASYGRWVLMDHPNGLATLVTHLSIIKVKPGDGVNRGEVIGYSGRTGYATGPHLHFSVFARQAVSVGQLRSRTCGRVMTLPLSPFGGYLNPLDYLRGR